MKFLLTQASAYKVKLIEVDSIEDLVKMRATCGYDIMLRDNYMKKCFKETNPMRDCDYLLEIMDD